MKKIRELLLQNVSTSQILVKNSLWLGMVEVVAKIIMFFVTISVVRYFGASDFGRLNYAQSFVGIVMLLSDFGINTILIRDIAKDKRHVAAYLTSALFVKLISTLLVVLLLALIVPNLSSTRADIALFLWVGAFLLMQSLGGLFNGVLTAYERMQDIFVTRVIYYLLILASVVTVTYFHLDLHALLSAYTLSAIAAALVATIFLRKLAIGLLPRVDMALTKRLLLESLPIFGLLAINQIYLNLDTVLIRMSHGAITVGYYQAAYKILFAFQAINLISTATFPRIAALYHMGEMAQLKKLAKLVLIGTSAVFVPFIAFVFVFAPALISRIYGASYLPSATVLPILLTAGVIMFYRTFIGNFFLAAHRQSLVFRASLIGLFINVALNYLLIPRVGLVQGGISLVVSESVMLGILGSSLTLKKTISN
ncbi:MAG: flippase [bacterium]